IWRSPLETRYGIYNEGNVHTFSLYWPPYGVSPQIAFGPDFFVTCVDSRLPPRANIEIVFLDSMERYFEEVNLEVKYVPGTIVYGVRSPASMTAYANGLDIAQDWIYSRDADAPIYTEHFWIQVPEPTTLLLLGLGGLMLRRKR
ncbi:MAG: PEP-CTERM sorting domain-containing protein, partial [Planctomycetes bacterium]|nr:PEP-CTERM sorting domain-containing protein [Planctomycetota bacterium]